MTKKATALVVRFSALGDVVLTTPLLRALRHAHPDLDVTFVTKAAYADLVSTSPWVNRVVALAPGESVRGLTARLTPPYDVLLDLHGSVRSLLLRAAIRGRWSTYRKRRAARWALVTFGIGRRAQGRPIAERYVEACRHLGVQPDGQRAEVFVMDADRAVAARLAPPTDYVALAPGAAHATKRWPGPHWHDLARRCRAMGLEVVAVGLPEERHVLDGAEIVDAFGVGLGPTAAVLERARIVVANDSGLMHLATAVGAPVIALFGPTVEAFGYAPYRSAGGRILQRALACRPCSAFGSRSCPLVHHRCMIELTPAMVADAVAAA